jgi:hypothetical protein
MIGFHAATTPGAEVDRFFRFWLLSGLRLRHPAVDDPVDIVSATALQRTGDVGNDQGRGGKADQNGADAHAKCLRDACCVLRDGFVTIRWLY